jgi:hypothetical protein
MHVRKAIIGMMIFTGLFLAAYLLNEQLSRYNKVLHDNNNPTDVTILHKEESDGAVQGVLNMYEPFKPREYIRIRQRMGSD